MSALFISKGWLSSRLIGDFESRAVIRGRCLQIAIRGRRRAPEIQRFGEDAIFRACMTQIVSGYMSPARGRAIF